MPSELLNQETIHPDDVESIINAEPTNNTRMTEAHRKLKSMPSDKAMQVAYKATHGPYPTEEIAARIDAAIAEARVEGAKVTQRAARDEVFGSFSLGQAVTKIDALDPQQVINESVK